MFAMWFLRGRCPGDICPITAFAPVARPARSSCHPSVACPHRSSSCLAPVSLSLEIDVFIQFIDGRSGPHQQRTGPSLAHSLGRCRISIIHLTAPTLARIAHQLNWTALRDLRSFKRVNYTLRLVYDTFRVGQKSKLLYCDRYFKGWTIALAFNIL